MHRSPALLILCLLIPCLLTLLLPPPGTAQGPPAQTTPAAPAVSQPKVIFQRSTDSEQDRDGKPRAPLPSGKGNATPVTTMVTDAMRQAPIFSSYDLAVHLVPAESSIAVEARLTLSNGGSEPLAILPLQLSSTLHVERVSLGGARLPLTQAQVASDADHTGALEETAVQLPQPLAPGASLALTVAYSGTIEPSTARLDRLQTPAALAARTDWDRISEDFTGLRGFGDVVWYPVCSVPALLGDGARLFAEIGRQRARNQEASIAIEVTDEFTGAAPDIAVLFGHVLHPGAPQAMPSAAFPGVLRFELPATRLGFRAPSLFLAVRTQAGPPRSEAGADLLRVFSTPEHAGDAENYQAAARLVEPLLAQWLGPRAGQPLAILDLPVNGAQPSEQGDAVLVSLLAPADATPVQIAPLLSREMAHARFHSPRAWLDEGVPALMENLYAEQTLGRDAALERLAASRDSLALIEPASPGSAFGQSLIDASDPIFYRAKALYVLTMLRDIAGDKALAGALGAYSAGADTQPEYFEKLVEQAGGGDLKWFFDAWVYRDMGLPDLSIASVFSSRTSGAAAPSDQWLVSIDVGNEGYAEAEVPVTIHSATHAVTERVRVPARSKVSRRMLIVGEPTSVEVNDGTVPEVQASVHQRRLGE